MFQMKYNKVSHIWHSIEAPIVLNTKASLGLVLMKALENNATKIAQISDDTGERFTFDDIRTKTIRAAENLQKRGYVQGQVFGIMTENDPYLAPIVLASLCLACPINPIDPSTGKEFILGMFESTQPSVVFCEARSYDLMVECLRDSAVKIFTFNGTKDGSEPVENLFVETGTEDEFVPIAIDDGENTTAFIMSTSGSTGPSKGVCLSHASFISEMDATIRIYADYGVILCFNSINWLSGLMVLIMGTAGGSTRIITTERFTVQLQFNIIAKHKVTVISSPSYSLLAVAKSDHLANANLSSVKTWISTGFKIPFAVLEEVNKYLPNGSVCNAYGLTEIADCITIDYPTLSGDTVGRFVNGYSVKVIDDNGNRCGIGDSGEIYIKNRVKFLGYHKKEELTNEAFDGDGFFKTGDIGHMDANGYLCFQERKKSTIIYFRFRLFPSEIEEVLLKSEEIKNCCVVGVPYDEVFELPAVVVVRAEGSNISQEDVCKIISDNMMDQFKLRGGAYFSDIIPITATGKPDRNAAKEFAMSLYKAKVENKLK